MKQKINTDLQNIVNARRYGIYFMKKLKQTHDKNLCYDTFKEECVLKK